MTGGTQWRISCQFGTQLSSNSVCHEEVGEERKNFSANSRHYRKVSREVISPPDLPNRKELSNSLNKRLRLSRGSVLAFGNLVRGFDPGRSRRIFRAKKSSVRLPSEGK